MSRNEKKSILDVTRGLLSTAYFHVLDLFPQPAPAEPSIEVKRLIFESGLSQSDLAVIHKRFQILRRLSGVTHTAHAAGTLPTSYMINIIPTNRPEVESLLRNILEIGGCYQTIDWSHFLYIFIKFCSLTKVEICQLLFLIIVRECKGLDSHYLTSAQLDRFYDRYRRDTTPESMNCSRIHFSNFPLSRYYATDFVEICFLYGPLVNPLMFLQRKLQQVLPSFRFWDDYNYLTGSNRKITLDFFLIKRQNLMMNSNQGFQETCDLLLLSSNLVHAKLIAQRSGSMPLSVSIPDSTASKSARIERVLELGFLSKNPKYMAGDDHSFKRIHAQLDKNALLKRKDSSKTSSSNL